MATEKQLSANRRNALKSTGPKTPAGKEQSKMNALKHGVLSESVVVTGHFYTEDPLQFEILHNDLQQDCRPVGRVEHLLVERIATCLWRLRRVIRAENGEIRLTADTGTLARLKQRQNAGELMARRGRPESDRWPSSSIQYVIAALERLRVRVQNEGGLTLEALGEISMAFENRDTVVLEQLRQLRQATPTGKDSANGSANSSPQQREVLGYLTQKIADFQQVSKALSEEETREDLARLDAAVLPSVETLDKLQRYETLLERQLYRAMNELERRQRQRAGEHIPAPLAMDIGR